jgi:hypothetical protein
MYGTGHQSRWKKNKKKTKNQKNQDVAASIKKESVTTKHAHGNSGTTNLNDSKLSHGRCRHCFVAVLSAHDVVVIVDGGVDVDG